MLQYFGCWKHYIIFIFLHVFVIVGIHYDVIRNCTRRALRPPLTLHSLFIRYGPEEKAALQTFSFLDHFEDSFSESRYIDQMLTRLYNHDKWDRKYMSTGHSSENDLAAAEALSHRQPYSYADCQSYSFDFPPPVPPRRMNIRREVCFLSRSQETKLPKLSWIRDKTGLQ